MDTTTHSGQSVPCDKQLLRHCYVAPRISHRSGGVFVQGLLESDSGQLRFSYSIARLLRTLNLATTLSSTVRRSRSSGRVPVQTTGSWLTAMAYHIISPRRHPRNADRRVSISSFLSEHRFRDTQSDTSSPASTTSNPSPRSFALAKKSDIDGEMSNEKSWEEKVATEGAPAVYGPDESQDLKPIYDSTHRRLRPRHIQLIGIGGLVMPS